MKGVPDYFYVKKKKKNPANEFLIIKKEAKRLLHLVYKALLGSLGVKGKFPLLVPFGT